MSENNFREEAIDTIEQATDWRGLLRGIAKAILYLGDQLDGLGGIEDRISEVENRLRN